MVKVGLGHLPEAMLAMFLHVELPSPSPTFHILLFGRSHYVQTTPKAWGVMFPLPRGEHEIIYINYLEFLCMGNLSLLPSKHMLHCLKIF